MSEFSCRMLKAELSQFEAAGVHIEPLFDELPFDRAFVDHPRNWVDWEHVAYLYHRIQDLVGSRDRFLGIITEYYGHTQQFKFATSLMRLIFSPDKIYWTAEGFMTRQMPIAAVQTQKLPDGRFRIDTSIPDSYVGCEVFFAATAVALGVLPTILGLPPAEVEYESGPHHVTTWITCPPSQTLWTRIRFAWQCLFNHNEIFRHLENDAIALTDKQRDIERLGHELQAMIETAAPSPVDSEVRAQIPSPSANRARARAFSS